MTTKERAEEVLRNWKSRLRLPYLLTDDDFIAAIEPAIIATIADVREACAKIVDRAYEVMPAKLTSLCGGAVLAIAEAIRAMSDDDVIARVDQVIKAAIEAEREAEREAILTIAKQRRETIFDVMSRTEQHTRAHDINTMQICELDHIIAMIEMRSQPEPRKDTP